jgi:hypothetical protein
MIPENPAIPPVTRPLSPETLVDGPWFERVKEAYAGRKGGRTPRWVFPVIGLVIAGVLFSLGGRWRTVAYFGAGLVMMMAVLEVANPKAAAAVHGGLAKFGLGLGKIIGWVFLVPAYLIVGPCARLLTRVIGGDPLALRAGMNPSFWAWADSEKRRVRQSTRMFCAERITGGRNWLAALFVMLLIGFVLGELVLRFYFGYHNPLLYQNDSQCGFRLSPHQDLITPRGRVQINNFSMRYSRDVTKEKPAGVFRILMIGDSTLFGGEYLTNEQTYASLVEQRLNSRYGAGGKKFEVFPISTNGWGPLHQLGWVEKNGTFSSDLTMVTTPAADIDRAKYLLESTRYMAVKPTLAWETVGTWGSWWARNKLGTRDGNYFQDYNEGLMQLHEGVRAFVDLGKLVRKTCPEVIFESLPQVEGYGQTALEGALHEGSRYKFLFDMLLPELRAAGFDMAYPVELFKGKGPKEDLFHDGAHLEWKGHDMYADYLISRILTTSPGFRKYAGLPQSAPAAAAPAQP